MDDPGIMRRLQSRAELKRNGVRVAWVSNRPSQVTAQRAEELKIDFIFQEKGNKVQAMELILKQAAATWDEVCYMGDDVVDLGALKRAGVAVAGVRRRRDSASSPATRANSASMVASSA